MKLWNTSLGGSYPLPELIVLATANIPPRNVRFLDGGSEGGFEYQFASKKTLNMVGPDRVYSKPASVQ